MEPLSNSLILYVGFQHREEQRMETERTFVNFVQVARRQREKYPVVNLANLTGKIER